MKFYLALFICLAPCELTFGHEDLAPTSTDTSPCFCQMDGKLDDCPCTAHVVDEFNSEKIYQPLMEILKTYYFRYFQVAFNKPCIFFAEDGACASKNCMVETCSINEVPDMVKTAEDIVENNVQDADSEERTKWNNCNEAEHLRPDMESSIHDKVDVLIEDEGHKQGLNEFCQLDPIENSENCQFVDLTRNPERFTGYSGRSVWKIWDTIYREICFQAKSPKDESVLPLNSATVLDMCLEKRAFYKIVSGLHSSITIHLCANYLLQEENVLMGLPPIWGQNKQEFNKRFSPKSTQNEGPERLKNAYFLYLIELRALAKAAPVLKNIDFSDENGSDNDSIKERLYNILENIQNFPTHFDEEKLFRDEPMDNPTLLTEFKEKFYQISELFDCIGCDRCKVWGKLQVTGIGTALKILLTPLNQIKLTKHETVALLNAFGRISTSIEQLKTFRN